MKKIRLLILSIFNIIQIWSSIKIEFVKLKYFRWIWKNEYECQNKKMTRHENNNQDPDVNFYHNFSMVDTQYLAPDKSNTNLRDFYGNYFSVLHLIIRNTNKNFEYFREYYSKVNHIFNVTRFSEIWASQGKINKNLSFQLKNYIEIHQARNFCKGGGLCIFIHESWL